MSAPGSQMLEAIDAARLLDTALRLVEVQSWTGQAGDAADRLAQILEEDGFEVQRPEADWPAAPAVVVRFDTGRAGPILQFDGHLDTVHLPFVPPRMQDGVLHGSGAADMKGGLAVIVEAMRVLRDTGSLPCGQLLFTAHDHHEAPWGDGRQLEALIRAGFVGDAVLIPEYLCDCLAIVGRGGAVFQIDVRRDGEPVHEMLGGIEQADVIAAGADLVMRFKTLDRQLAAHTDSVAGRESVFVGLCQGGEIYNQSPVSARIEGTRRWLPGADREAIGRQFDALLAEVARDHGVQVEGSCQTVREAFQLDEKHPFVSDFQSAHEQIVGRVLPTGAKAFLDDGNTFFHHAGIPAITHGPNATGAHTLDERVPVSELVRTTKVYVQAAMNYCGARC